MKPYHIAMGVALAGAAALAVFGDNTPSSDIAEPVARPPKAAGAVAAVSAARSGKDGKATADAMILRLVPRAALVGDSADASFGAGEGVFLGQNWNPPPPPPPPRSQSNAPPPPPMAPPVPFNYFGKAVADGQWEVYLARGDKTYVVRNKTVIEGAYRVDRIAPPLMTVTYLPLNQVQQINIGAFD
ncbi:hypothetical protein SAMN05428959_10247 [Duganella sp. CF517]|uniref:hypothetical protein n=1 Tax=Duganella sp. CF517 TaxID=1881038 RepID=UPI0008B0894D|nr:hypothetical protein [Duganella sp. CF517]SEN47496.1 hypothetical protein SAMN05428959_10247 [Duganella sp. CF517]